MQSQSPSITSVWSAYGHRFMSDSGDDTVSCLTCGAMYELSPLADDPTRGEYHAANGDAPLECTRDTAMVHGYPGERHCDSCDDIAGCEHCAHHCICLLCA